MPSPSYPSPSPQGSVCLKRAALAPACGPKERSHRTSHPHPNVCAQAPGKYLTAEWEFWLYMFRVLLLWVTFFQLNFLQERLTRRRKKLAARARTEATMRARRGLLPPAATVALQLALPLLLFVATLRSILAGGHSILATNSATGNPSPIPIPPHPYPYPYPYP